MTAGAPMPDLLTPQEVASIFRVELDTLAKWRWKKVGPKPIKIGRMVRYPRDRVEAVANGEPMPWPDEESS